ncbi:hypothetical protein ACSQ67_001112 [Phaseolus vulgaris]
MQKPETQGNQPPLGYPTENPPARRKLFSASKKKASVLCVAAGFVKNASELQFWLENYIGMLARAVTASFLVC